MCLYVKAYLFKNDIFMDNKVGARKPILTGWNQNHHPGD